ncbi:FG-GAP-like repeat-containing protein [Chloroflexota bacterium]
MHLPPLPPPSTRPFAEVTGAENPLDGVDVGVESAPGFADLDGDGDLDAFIGEEAGSIYYYRNDGTVASPSFTAVTDSGNPFDGVDVGVESAPGFADLDGDGDLDAFIGENEGIINYYRNDGTAASPSFTAVTGSLNPFDGVDVGEDSDPGFADLDGDGDLDAFIGEYYGAIFYYRSDGTVTSPSFAAVAGDGNPFDEEPSVTNESKPSFADLDGDGDLDAFIGATDGTIYYYRNDGTAAGPSFTEVTGGGNPFNGVDVGDRSAPSSADLDGDGDLDAFIGATDGTIYYYRNDGTATSPSFTAVTGTDNPLNDVDVGGNSIPRFADLDGDGDLDAFVGEFFGNIKYYRNDGTAASPSFTEVTGGGNPFNGVDVGDRSAPSFADLDGDGDLDAFIGATDGTIYYYRNDGTAASPSFTEVTGGGNPFNGVDVGDRSAPSFADLDGDGDLDAFIGEDVGIINYYRSNRAPGAGSLTAVSVNEDAPDTAVDLWPALQDPDHTPASSLAYGIAGSTNPALFSSAVISSGQYLALDYAPEANGAGSMTVQATDPGGLWVTTTLQVTVNPVNDAPSFVKGQDRYVAEDSGPASYPTWATGFSPGPADESAQALTLTLEYDNPALFATAPAIDLTTGDLSFTPASDTWGTATVTATLQDDGGTAHGGVDTSAPQTFMITVYAVNDNLDVEAGANQVGVEGETLDFSGSFSDPDDSQVVHDADVILWDFGDSRSANGGLTAQHAYGDNGTYTATLIVVDDENGAGWDTLQVTISNAATSLGDFPDLEAEVGQVVTVTGVLTDAGYLDTHDVEIGWADGLTTTLALGAEERQFDTPHTYVEAGEYIVTVKASDKDGSWDQKGFNIGVSVKKYPVYLPLVTRW